MSQVIKLQEGNKIPKFEDELKVIQAKYPDLANSGVIDKNVEQIETPKEPIPNSIKINDVEINDDFLNNYVNSLSEYRNRIKNKELSQWDEQVSNFRDLIKSGDIKSVDEFGKWTYTGDRAKNIGIEGNIDVSNTGRLKSNQFGNILFNNLRNQLSEQSKRNKYLQEQKEWDDKNSPNKENQEVKEIPNIKRGNFSKDFIKSISKNYFGNNDIDINNWNYRYNTFSERSKNLLDAITNVYSGYNKDTLPEGFNIENYNNLLENLPKKNQLDKETVDLMSRMGLQDYLGLLDSSFINAAKTNDKENISQDITDKDIVESKPEESVYKKSAIKFKENTVLPKIWKDELGQSRLVLPDSGTELIGKVVEDSDGSPYFVTEDGKVISFEGTTFEGEKEKEEGLKKLNDFKGLIDKIKLPDNTIPSDNTNISPNISRRAKSYMKSGGIVILQDGGEVSVEYIGGIPIYSSAKKAIENTYDPEDNSKLKEHMRSKNLPEFLANRGDDASLSFRDLKNDKYELSEGDKYEMASLIADVVSIGSSYVPGYGTAASLATGLASTGLSAKAQYEKTGGVDIGDTLGNLGLNVLAAVPAVGPAVKGGKVATKFAQALPKIINLVKLSGAAYGIQASIPQLNDLQKRFEDPNFSWSDLNMDDLRTLANLSTVLIGGTRGIKGGIRAKNTPETNRIKITANNKKYNLNLNESELASIKSKPNVSEKVNRVKEIASSRINLDPNKIEVDTKISGLGRKNNLGVKKKLPRFQKDVAIETVNKTTNKSGDTKLAYKMYPNKTPKWAESNRNANNATKLLRDTGVETIPFSQTTPTQTPVPSTVTATQGTPIQFTAEPVRSAPQVETTSVSRVRSASPQDQPSSIKINPETYKPGEGLKMRERKNKDNGKTLEKYLENKKANQKLLAENASKAKEKLLENPKAEVYVNGKKYIMKDGKVTSLSDKGSTKQAINSWETKIHKGKESKFLKSLSKEKGSVKIKHPDDKKIGKAIAKEKAIEKNKVKSRLSEISETLNKDKERALESIRKKEEIKKRRLIKKGRPEKKQFGGILKLQNGKIIPYEPFLKHDSPWLNEQDFSKLTPEQYTNLINLYDKSVNSPADVINSNAKKFQDYYAGIDTLKPVINYVGSQNKYDVTTKGKYDPKNPANYNLDSRRRGITDSWLQSVQHLRNNYNIINGKVTKLPVDKLNPSISRIPNPNKPIPDRFIRENNPEDPNTLTRGVNFKDRKKFDLGYINLYPEIRLADSLRTNKKIYDIQRKSMKPAFLMSPEINRKVTYNTPVSNAIRQEGLNINAKSKQEGEKYSDPRIAVLARLQGQQAASQYNTQAGLQDFQEYLRTGEAAQQQDKENIINRTNTANQNTQIGSDFLKRLGNLKAGYQAANYGSREKYLLERDQSLRDWIDEDKDFRYQEGMYENQQKIDQFYTPIQESYNEYYKANQNNPKILNMDDWYKYLAPNNLKQFEGKNYGSLKEIRDWVNKAQFNTGKSIYGKYPIFMQKSGGRIPLSEKIILENYKQRNKKDIEESRNKHKRAIENARLLQNSLKASDQKVSQFLSGLSKENLRLLRTFI